MISFRLQWVLHSQESWNKQHSAWFLMLSCERAIFHEVDPKTFIKIFNYSNPIIAFVGFCIDCGTNDGISDEPLHIVHARLSLSDLEPQSIWMLPPFSPWTTFRALSLPPVALFERELTMRRFMRVSAVFTLQIIIYTQRSACVLIRAAQRRHKPKNIWLYLVFALISIYVHATALLHTKICNCSPHFA